MNDKDIFAFGGISFLIAKLLAFGLMIKALLDIKKLCGEPLLALFLIYTLCLAAAAFLTSFGAKSGLDDMKVFLLIAGVLLFASWHAMWYYYEALSKIGDEKSFWAVIWLNTLGFLVGIVAALMMSGNASRDEFFIVQTIVIILSLIAFFVELYAWSQVKKFKKIENSNSNGDDEASNRDS